MGAGFYGPPLRSTTSDDPTRRQGRGRRRIGFRPPRPGAVALVAIRIPKTLGDSLSGDYIMGLETIRATQEMRRKSPPILQVNSPTTSDLSIWPVV